jgi:transcriptional regulator with XRE-family HTH domain
MAIKKKKVKVLKHNLKTIRQSEGMKVTELAKLSGVSPKSIHGLESLTRNISIELRYKILNGLNRNRSRTKDWAYKDVFPNDALPENG